MKPLIFIALLATTLFLCNVRAADPKPKPPASAPATGPAVEVQADGSLLLKAEGARIHGFHLHLDPKPEPTLVYWIDPTEYAEWPHAVAKKGTYAVEVTYACPPKAGGEFGITAAANHLTAKAEHTIDWQTFTTVKIGTISVLNDNTSIAIKSYGRPPRPLISIRSIKLTPVAEDAPKKKNRGK